MNLLLSIETAGRELGVSIGELVDRPRVPLLAHHFRLAPGQQSELLIPTIDRLFRPREAKGDRLALLAVDVGPGSFTGVRVGVATGRALAQALRLPLIGVSGLAAMAAEQLALSPRSRTVVAWRPALAGEVYVAVYVRDTAGVALEGNEMVAPCWTTVSWLETKIATLARQNGGISVVVAEPAREKITLPTRIPLVLRPPHPTWIGQLAARRWFERPVASAFPLEAVEPLYLQPAWAQRHSKGSQRSLRPRE